MIYLHEQLTEKVTANSSWHSCISAYSFVSQGSILPPTNSHKQSPHFMDWTLADQEFVSIPNQQRHDSRHFFSMLHTLPSTLI